MHSRLFLLCTLLLPYWFKVNYMKRVEISIKLHCYKKVQCPHQRTSILENQWIIAEPANNTNMKTPSDVCFLLTNIQRYYVYVWHMLIANETWNLAHIWEPQQKWFIIFLFRSFFNKPSNLLCKRLLCKNSII